MSRPSATFRSSVIGLLPHVQRGHLAQRQSVALPPPLRQLLALRAQLQPRGVGVLAPHAQRDVSHAGRARARPAPPAPPSPAPRPVPRASPLPRPAPVSRTPPRPVPPPQQRCGSPAPGPPAAPARG